MNGKKAKRLRAEAQRLTVGLPWERYQRNKRKGVNKEGKELALPGTVRLDPTCGKGVYRALKRGTYVEAS